MTTNQNVDKALSERLIYISKILSKNFPTFNVVPVITEINGKVGVWILENECEPIEINPYLRDLYTGNLKFSIPSLFLSDNLLGDALIKAHNAWKEKNKK